LSQAIWGKFFYISYLVHENSAPCALLMVRIPLPFVSVIVVAFGASLVGAAQAPDCTASSGCSVTDEEVATTMDKTLLVRARAVPKPVVEAPEDLAAMQVNESRAASQDDPGTWEGVWGVDGTRRRRRRDPDDTSHRRRRTRSPGTNCGDIQLTIKSASGLRDADKHSKGKSDPYAQFKYWLCGDDYYEDLPPPVVKTETLDENLNPVWNYNAVIKSIDFDIDVGFYVIDADVGAMGDNLGTLEGKFLDLGPPGEQTHTLKDGEGATLTYFWKRLS